MYRIFNLLLYRVNYFLTDNMWEGNCPDTLNKRVLILRQHVQSASINLDYLLDRVTSFIKSVAN